MARTFEYAILTAVPDPRRGERVNVGLIVFCGNSLDVRFHQAESKLKALTGLEWHHRVNNIKNRIANMYRKDLNSGQILDKIKTYENIVVPSRLGWFVADSQEGYELRLEELLKSLVTLPKKAKKDKQSRINTEIAAEFKRLNVLATKNENLEQGKIIKNFVLGGDEGLRADFALRNGKVHITSTLDLRKYTAGLEEAALKSIVLDKSQMLFGKDNARRIGVYAVNEGATEQFKNHIALLAGYADVIYNWSSHKDQLAFKQSMIDIVMSGPLFKVGS